MSYQTLNVKVDAREVTDLLREANSKMMSVRDSLYQSRRLNFVLALAVLILSVLLAITVTKLYGASNAPSNTSPQVSAGAVSFTVTPPAVSAVAAPAPPSTSQLIEAYIISVNPRCKDAALAAEYLARAASESGLDWRLLAAVARYESTFDVHARGSAGERGLLQIHPVHRPRFAKAGLDWNSAADQVRFAACVMLAPNVERYGLKAALRPWAVRSRALREYARLLKLYANTEPPMDRL